MKNQNYETKSQNYEIIFLLSHDFHVYMITNSSQSENRFCCCSAQTEVVSLRGHGARPTRSLFILKMFYVFPPLCAVLSSGATPPSSDEGPLTPILPRCGGSGTWEAAQPQGAGTDRKGRRSSRTQLVAPQGERPSCR